MADAEPAQGEEQQQGDVEREAPVEQEATAAADEGQQVGAELPMSKNQMKKLRKKQFYEEKNRQRKEREKQQKQAEQDRRRAEGKERIAAMTEEEAAKWREERNARGVARKQERDAGRAKMEKALESGQRIVLDLSFADLMREGELKSICSQLGYCWHANCSAAQPAHMVLSSVEGKMKEFLTRQITGYSNWKATITPQSYLEHFTVQGVPQDKLVYLTADSDNELGELDPAAVYIIGGIVDRNRHKQLCYNKAVEEGISHARLPIGGFIQLASSPVMTTNHVVDIMLRWLELRDWKKAFEAVIPNRKRKHGEDGDGEEEEEEEEGKEEREEPQQQQGQPAELQPKEEQAEQQPAAAAAAGGETQQ